MTKNIFVDKSNISVILTHPHDDEFYFYYIDHMTKRRKQIVKKITGWV